MNQVTVTNIDISFGRLVGLIFKFMLASIPAVILFYLVMATISVLFLVLIGGIAGSAGFFDSISEPAIKDALESMKEAKPEA